MISRSRRRRRRCKRAGQRQTVGRAMTQLSRASPDRHFPGAAHGARCCGRPPGPYHQLAAFSRKPFYARRRGCRRERRRAQLDTRRRHGTAAPPAPFAKRTALLRPAARDARWPLMFAARAHTLRRHMRASTDDDDAFSARDVDAATKAAGPVEAAAGPLAFEMAAEKADADIDRRTSRRAAPRHTALKISHAIFLFCYAAA